MIFLRINIFEETFKMLALFPESGARKNSIKGKSVLIYITKNVMPLFNGLKTIIFKF